MHGCTFLGLRCWSVEAMHKPDWLCTSTQPTWCEPYRRQETLALEATFEWRWNGGIMYSNQRIATARSSLQFWSNTTFALLFSLFSPWTFLYEEVIISVWRSNQPKVIQNKSIMCHSLICPFKCLIPITPKITMKRHPFSNTMWSIPLLPVPASNPSGWWVAVTGERERNRSHSQQSLLE